MDAQDRRTKFEALHGEASWAALVGQEPAANRESEAHRAIVHVLRVLEFDPKAGLRAARREAILRRKARVREVELRQVIRNQSARLYKHESNPF